MPTANVRQSYNRFLVASLSPARDQIIDILIGQGSHCEIVETGSLAIEYLSSKQFDVLITDYVLEDIDVWRLSAIVHSGRIGPPIPIILLHDPEEIPIPSILTREYQFKIFPVENIEELPNFIKHMRIVMKPNVLIVEDDPNAIDIAQYALQKDYELTIAKNGEEAIEAWQHHHHDLVLLDLMLPGISGANVLRQILDTNPQQPIIVVTADGKIDSYKHLLLTGAIEFISKPYKLDNLRKACRIAVNKARLMRDAERHQNLIVTIAEHVWAASYHLKSGNFETASRHLNYIMETIPDALPSEDSKVLLFQ